MRNSAKKQDGFTIIEVLIVLAIAALILVVVLVAIPQLQRNQRNSARQNIAGRVVAEINNFAGNNNGLFPAGNLGPGTSGTPVRQNLGAPGIADSFFERYLDCGTSTAVPVICGVDISDPQTGSAIGTGTNAGDSVTLTAANNSTANEPGDAPGSISYTTNAICNGEILNTADASGRNYAFMMRLEGGAVFCLDNR